MAYNEKRNTGAGLSVSGHFLPMCPENSRGAWIAVCNERGKCCIGP
jgi:hypothetical protein